MCWLNAIMREGVALFVDDGSFAAAILVWLAVIWGLLHLGLLPQWLGPILFIGLALILIESASRRVRRR